MLFTQRSAGLMTLLSASLMDLTQTLTVRNPMRIAIDRNTLQPHPLPFPMSRLTESALQKIDQRSQVMGKHGCFVLTNVNMLPPGGHKIVHSIGDKNLELKIVGDMGNDNQLQSSVVELLIENLKNGSKGCAPLVWGVGDWVYPRGPMSLSDAEVKRTREMVLDKYQGLSQYAPIYGILGNHEFGDDALGADPAAFMQLAQQHQIEFPGRYYLVEINGNGWAADLIAIDSSTLVNDVTQLNWIQNCLKSSIQREEEEGQRRWRGIIGHHPIIAYGTHEKENEFIGELLIDDIDKIDLYVAGHEHTVQLLKGTDISPLTLICGTGSDEREPKTGPETAFSSGRSGFADITFNKEGFSINFNAIN